MCVWYLRWKCVPRPYKTLRRLSLSTAEHPYRYYPEYFRDTMNTTASVTTTAPQSSIAGATTVLPNYVEVRVLRGLTGLLWGLVALGSASIIWCALIPYLYRRKRHTAIISDPEKEEDQRRWLYPSPSWAPVLKQYLTYAPLWKRRRAESSRSLGALPTRLQAIFMASYFLSNIAYLVLLDWSAAEQQRYTQLRKRSGTIAVANMLPLVVLAARNNPLIRMLDISYDACNFCHRWIGAYNQHCLTHKTASPFTHIGTGRTMILESVVHVAAYIYPKVTYEGWPALASKMTSSQFIGSGTAGFTTLLVIFLLSLKPLRSAAYEVFKRVHLILALAFTAAILAHSTVSLRPPQRAFLLTAAAILFCERCTRLFILYHRNRSGSARSWAIVETLPGHPRACRVTLHLPRRLALQPGTHAYLSLAAVRPLESHPFSIAWWQHHASDTATPPTTTTTTVSFIIGAREGFTRALYDHAARESSGCFRTDASLEGPYGGHRSLDTYGHAVLFAGGTGITHQLPFAWRFLEAYGGRKVATRRVVLVWAVREAECIEWIRPWLEMVSHLRALGSDIFRLRLFVTGSKGGARRAGEGVGVRTESGRPDVAAIIEREALEQIGAMCVSVCGPGGFADDVRAAVRDAQRWQQDIDFVEESFGW